MMLGRIIPGRLPTTQANTDLIQRRIQQVQRDMKTLDNQVSAGKIDSRQAAYRRQQLIGEVDELKRVIANSRLSTPSYKVPREIRGQKPAKKYVAQADSRAFFTEYEGKQPINKIPSEWQAKTLTELDIPTIPRQPVMNSNWPSHWPGNHSPMIMNEVISAGKPHVDPRSNNYGFNVNTLVTDYTYTQQAKQIVSKYKLLRDNIANDVKHTPGDRTLVSQIITKLTTHLAEGEQALEAKRAASAKAAEAQQAAQQAEGAYQGQDDSNSGNNEQPQKGRQQGNNASDLMNKRELTQQQWNSLTPQQQQQWMSLEAQRNQGYEQEHERRLQEEADERQRRLEQIFEPQQGIKLPALLGRRRGNTMALGAMQAHDRFNNMSADRGSTLYQRKSYLATEREMTLARARAGAKVDVTQQLKDAPVTRPWSMQVTMTMQQLEQLHLQLDQALTSIGLNQSMFTQQAHNYIAQILNSLDSSMNPSDRTEFVVEKIMSEMVNRSALLKDNVRVDVRQNGWPPVNIAPADTTSVDGLGSAFLKTKAAMGRLLG